MAARALVAVLALLAAANAGGDNPYSALLRGRGIEPTPAGITAFLNRCIPDEDTPRQIAELIRTLSHDDVSLREAAVRRLSRIPFLARKAVKEASRIGDPEVRRLCIRIQRAHVKARFEEVVAAVLQTIQHEKLPGLVEVVAGVIPHCDVYLLLPARQALIATARPGDAPLLRTALAHENPHVRAAAIEALRKVHRGRARPDLRPMLADKDEFVRLTAAETLAALGERRSLPALGRLLDSETAAVRYRAAAVLRAITDRKFEYVSYDDATARAAAAQRWRNYIAEHGERIRLRLPLVVRTNLLNRTLVCSFTTKRLEEYDSLGNKVFATQTLAVPWGCQGLPNGHRLVAVFAGRMVVEYNDKGREVWRTKSLPGKPMSVRRLQNGNTLVSCGDSGKVVEVGPAGTVVWSITLPGRPSDARRLRDGRTLVALWLGKRVVEVDRRGKILWQIRGNGGPSTAERLGNGNTLVAGLAKHGVVTEYDGAGNAVWNLKVRGTAYEAQRLRNGNTLVGTTRGVAEYSPRGRVVWRKDVGACRVMRY